MWNYKYADVEFGRLQARDLLQHLWTGPISNAPVDIVQGSRSVEARPVSVSKGAAMHQMVSLMSKLGGHDAIKFEYVLCMGHYLGRDENLFSYFEGVGVGAGPGAPGKEISQHAGQLAAFRVRNPCPTPSCLLCSLTALLPKPAPFPRPPLAPARPPARRYLEPPPQSTRSARWVTTACRCRRGTAPCAPAAPRTRTAARRPPPACCIRCARWRGPGRARTSGWTARRRQRSRAYRKATAQEIRDGAGAAWTYPA